MSDRRLSTLVTSLHPTGRRGTKDGDCCILRVGSSARAQLKIPTGCGIHDASCIQLVGWHMRSQARSLAAAHGLARKDYARRILRVGVQSDKARLMSECTPAYPRLMLRFSHAPLVSPFSLEFRAIADSSSQASMSSLRI